MSYYILSKCCSKNIRHSFTDKEDDQLKKLVLEYGEHDWKTIADNLGTRTPRQCRERYRNYLMPGIVNGPWTVDDDMLLYSKFLEIGPHWTIISQFFPSRSEINIKNRWAALSNKRNNKNMKQKSASSDSDPSVSSSSSYTTLTKSSDLQESSSEEKINLDNLNKSVEIKNDDSQKLDEQDTENGIKANESTKNDIKPKICELNPFSLVESITPISSSSVKSTSDEEESEFKTKTGEQKKSIIFTNKYPEDRKQEILFSMIEQDLFSFNFDMTTDNSFTSNDFNLFFK